MPPDIQPVDGIAPGYLSLHDGQEPVAVVMQAMHEHQGRPDCALRPPPLVEQVEVTGAAERSLLVLHS